MLRKAMLTLSLCGVLIAGAQASQDDELVRPVQDRWAQIKYRSPEKQHAEQFHELALAARKISEANPNAAAALIWEGIVVSSEAGARGET